jgi:poly(A) polymerase/tRNA nucleotidyltransferase (CCA-adding enzyme)
MTPMLTIPHELVSISRILKDNGFECYLVGGGVRDQLLGLPVKDYDIATNAQPFQVQALFHRVIPTGIQHGTVSVLFKGKLYEVTTYRIDGKYTDGRRPDSITFTGSIEEDLKRRDFTINSIAYDIQKGDIFDPNNGRADLKKRLIRAIGIPEERFGEDSLRVIRACRFSAQLDFDLEENTARAIGSALDKLEALSKERIYEELQKIMCSRQPSRAFRLFHDTGILSRILPELQACSGVEQKGRHRFDVFEHSIFSCDGVPLEYPKIRFAALLHDIGKPGVRLVAEDGEIRFHRHEEEGTRLAEGILERFRFPKNDAKYILHLIRHHMFHYTPDWSDSAVRRFIARVRKEYVTDLFILRFADSYAHDRQWHQDKSLDELRDRIDDFLEKQHAFSLKDLKINGHILTEEGHIPRGPFMGRIMDFLLEAVLEDPHLNNKEDLLRLAGNFYREYY